jgi:hypothetical protein
MQLYDEKDLEVIKKNAGEIIDKVQEIKLTNYEPTRHEMRKVYDEIKQFIRDNNRIIYGGYALNELLKEVNKDEAIYTDLDVPDIEFYSPDPITDLINLCNILHDKGFKYVQGTEGQHGETYKLFSNTVQYCDISYVPTNVYRRMPFKTIDGLRMIHPHFMLIDYYRMFNDPINSYWRLIDKKAFKRGYILQKNYPIHTSDTYNYPKYNNKDQQLNMIRNTVLDFLKNRETVIVHGLYALNYFASHAKHKKYPVHAVPHYEFISTDYVKDGNELLAILSKQSDKIRKTEYYPFFQFYGYRAKIFYGDEPIATIYHHNNMCIPFQTVPALMFDEGKVIESKNKKDTIQLTVYNYAFMMFRIMSIKARVDEDKNKERGLKALSFNLVEMRTHYLKTNKKTILDATIFREFSVDCIGKTIDPMRTFIENIKKKKQKGGPLVFRYDPGTVKKTNAPDFKFANSSGNPIQNTKNFKLTMTYIQ